jgi:glycosyltransferase involved in cell wall biosynthesis
MTVRVLKIMAVGLRGIPNVQGGIETHAAELYPRLVELGAEVTVLGRQRYRPADVGRQWHGIRLRWLWSPRQRGFEAAVHTALGVLFAGIRRPDVLHIHAVGPSITTPLAKMLGLRVVVTHHGQDYLREKWNGPERSIIRLGEQFAVRFSDALITVSSTLQAMIRSQYGREVTCIPNGVAEQHEPTGHALLDKYRLTRGRYVIQIGRLVPEKRQLDLILAFRAAQLPAWGLVLVGGAQGDKQYAAAVSGAAGTDNQIICTGALAASDAQELLAGAGVFVLPSSHEGLPIALLEALAHGVPSLASDIPGNREIGMDADSYFTVGDVPGLTAHLRALALSTEARAATVRRYPEICRRFDWDQIAQATIAVMEAVARKPRKPRPGSLPQASTAVVDSGRPLSGSATAVEGPVSSAAR